MEGGVEKKKTQKKQQTRKKTEKAWSSERCARMGKSHGEGESQLGKGRTMEKKGEKKTQFKPTVRGKGKKLATHYEKRMWEKERNDLVSDNQTTQAYPD